MPGPHETMRLYAIKCILRFDMNLMIYRDEFIICSVESDDFANCDFVRLFQLYSAELFFSLFWYTSFVIALKPNICCALKEQREPHLS